MRNRPESLQGMQPFSPTCPPIHLTPQDVHSAAMYTGAVPPEILEHVKPSEMTEGMIKFGVAGGSQIEAQIKGMVTFGKQLEPEAEQWIKFMFFYCATHIHRYGCTDEWGFPGRM